ncbi:MAG: PAS domain S-box protein, partial [Elusimicrobiales bacterium]
MTTKIEPKEGFILIVEDDIGLGRLEAERLAPLGFKLRHAASAGEARAILIKAAPDLMLLDYSLPDSNAVDFLKELRESGGAVPPFVIVTGRGDETVAVDSMKCGAVDYIIKSGDFLENLLPAVAKALEKIALLKKLEDARRSTAKNLRLYNFLAQVNLASSRTKDRVLLFRRICEIAVKNGGMRMAWIGRPDNDLGRIIPLCWAGFVDGYLDLIEIDLGVESPRSKGPTGASVSSGELRACSDIASDPLMAPWREKALERNYRSSAAIPLVECGKLAAVLTLYSDQSEFFTGDELELLNEIKADISLALDAISVEEKRCAAQEVLNRTAGQLAHVMDATSVVILTMRHRASGMNIKWVSGNAEALTGFLPVEILLPGWLEKNLHPQDKAMVETGQKDLLRTGSVTQDFRFKKKNGGYFWVHAQLKVVSAEAGEIIGSWTDITPLKESEMRFQELFEKVPVGYQSLDGGGNLLAVNETWTGIFGYTREEALGRNFAEFLSSGSKNAFAASFTAFMASGESAGVELEIKRKDGSVRHIAFNSKAGHNPDGSFKQAHCVAADITEKKKSESRFRDLLDSLPGGVIVRCGPEVIYVNASGLKMMGFKNERALLGREVLTLLPEELRPDFRRRMEEIDSRGIVTPPMPVRLPRHDGSIADIEISGAPIDFGDRKCGLVFFNDISERKKAERLMTEMSNMQRVESLGALAGGIAHDFNNMLTGIMGNLSLLSARSDLDPGAAAIIHDTLEAVNSAKSLTAQLLAFSKGGRPIKKEFCLGTALNEIFQLSTSGTKAACKIEIP